MRGALTIGAVFVLGLATELGGCASPSSPAAEPSDAGTTSPDWPAAELPSSTSPEPGVRRDAIHVPGVLAPPNPLHADATPPEGAEATRVLRYRADVSPPAEAAAILLALPGFLGGAAGLDPLARSLVRRSTAAGRPVEVWLLDRRSNLLEDLRGMEAAEALGDPAVAEGYYFGGETIGGHPFEGFLSQERTAYLSEWGLAVHLEDLRRVVALVPAAHRTGRLFLLGYSMGGAMAEAYAAWRFTDGHRGVEDLAGIVLLDGTLPPAPLTEEEYRRGVPDTLPSRPGIDAIRERSRYAVLPLLGVSVHARVEIMAMQALLAPEAVAVDRRRDRLLQLILGLPPVRMPSFTNRAALGFAFDRDTTPIVDLALSLGEPTGGPLERYHDDLSGAELLRPSDSGATYDWIDARDSTPAELTSIEGCARSFAEGPSNLSEWYFPNRLVLDVSAAGGAALAEDAWQVDYGLRAFDAALVDAPVLAVAAEVDAASYEPARRRVAAILGDGRRHAGTPRSDPRAFRVVEAPGLTHADVITADDGSGNPIPAAVEAFVLEHAADGAVAIPEMLP